MECEKSRVPVYEFWFYEAKYDEQVPYSSGFPSRARVERKSPHDAVGQLLVCFGFTRHSVFGNGVSP